MKVKFDVDTKITKEFLLNHFSQETFLEYYLEIPVKKGLFRNPMRQDRTPTASFYKNTAGDIIFKDFSGFCSVNFIGVVMLKYGVTYYKALQIIANDFNLVDRPNLVKCEKPITVSKTEFVDSGPCKIQIEIQPFSNEELEWWGKYGVTENTLRKFNVFSCKTVFLNSEYFTSSSKSQMIFGYYRGKDTNGIELWRCYFPGRSSFKFLANWKSFMIQGAKQLPKENDILVVTKSMKDVMVLHELGLPAIAPCSENLCLSESQYEKLKHRFKHIILFYDNDLPGISNMNKFRKQIPALIPVWIPKHYGAKDISDFYAKYGKITTINLINEAVEKLGFKRNS